MRLPRRGRTKNDRPLQKWQLACRGRQRRIVHQIITTQAGRTHTGRQHRETPNGIAGTGGWGKSPLIEREAKAKGGGGAQERARSTGYRDGFRLTQACAAY
ncbi:MAG TPA: hypothetical protein VN688_28395 [Gemmataceae bacterium]|nr:hypothetical protein [Gemmataceae bacterium]